MTVLNRARAAVDTRTTARGAVDSRDLGLLTLRVGLGGTLLAHGAQKLFGMFGGHGLAGTGAFFDSVGFTPGRANAVIAGVSEAGGGALLALGLATPAAGAAVAGTMAVASTMHKDNGFFAQAGGYEYPAFLGLAGAALALSGPGGLSVDAALAHRANRHWMRAVALASVPVAVGLVVRRREAVLAARAGQAGAVAAPVGDAGSASSPDEAAGTASPAAVLDATS